MKPSYNRTVDDWEALADFLINYLIANIGDINTLREEDGQELIETSDVESVFRLGPHAKRKVKLGGQPCQPNREILIEQNGSDYPGLCITFPGYGTFTAEGDDPTILIEYSRGGTPRLHAWSDLSEENPTHCIAFDKAKLR